MGVEVHEVRISHADQGSRGVRRTKAPGKLSVADDGGADSGATRDRLHGARHAIQKSVSSDRGSSESSSPTAAAGVEQERGVPRCHQGTKPPLDPPLSADATNPARAVLYRT
ncbi:hypothetical protein FM110_06945 [Brachybacterium nesterenkovii]|uniref:Uncharacterized protein n=1 Tax=Brachybacterium nesterenkovii TaxID=47847 RepID=A0A1X6X011_9MICO|nr:hypothetical protein FM110_06945 [Brachybacterium nesterenkovii]